MQGKNEAKLFVSNLEHIPQYIDEQRSYGNGHAK
jgi:hypothetical protein